MEIYNLISFLGIIELMLLACLMTGAVAGLFTTAAHSPIIKF